MGNTCFRSNSVTNSRQRLTTNRRHNRIHNPSNFCHTLKIFYLNPTYDVIITRKYNITHLDLKEDIETAELHHYNTPGLDVSNHNDTSYNYAISVCCIDRKIIKISLAENAFENPVTISIKIFEIYDKIHDHDSSIIRPIINSNWFVQQYNIFLQHRTLTQSQYAHVIGTCDICFEEDVQLCNVGCCIYNTCIKCKLELLKHKKIKCSFCNRVSSMKTFEKLLLGNM
jgi:hypothetical protein